MKQGYVGLAKRVLQRVICLGLNRDAGVGESRVLEKDQTILIGALKHSLQI